MIHMRISYWVKEGLGWGVLMYMIMTIIYPLCIGQEITLKHLLIGAIMWPIGGLAYGYSMKLFRGNEKPTNPTD